MYQAAPQHQAAAAPSQLWPQRSMPRSWHLKQWHCSAAEPLPGLHTPAPRAKRMAGQLLAWQSHLMGLQAASLNHAHLEEEAAQGHEVRTASVLQGAGRRRAGPCEQPGRADGHAGAVVLEGARALESPPALAHPAPHPLQQSAYFVLFTSHEGHMLVSSLEAAELPSLGCTLALICCQHCCSPAVGCAQPNRAGM